MNGITDARFKPYILVFNNADPVGTFTYTFCDTPAEALTALNQQVASVRGGEAVLYLAVNTASVPVPSIVVKNYP